MKISDLLAEAVGALVTANIEEARIEAELLIGFCLNLSRTALYLSAETVVEEKEVNRFRRLLFRRVQREPLAYITGEREFWSLPFHVSPAVLIPRPETEFVLETVLAHSARQEAGNRFVDLGCGSGVIATVLALELNGTGVAIDISAEALQVARRNLCRHQVDARVSLVQSNLFTGFREKQCRFPLIVSNPPYVKHAQLLEELEPEVALYEPRLALDGGSSGLAVIKEIRNCLPGMLDDGGDCFLEIGDGQADSIRRLFLDHQQGHIYEFVHIFKDYSDRERVVHIRRKNRQD